MEAGEGLVVSSVGWRPGRSWCSDPGSSRSWSSRLIDRNRKGLEGKGGKKNRRRTRNYIVFSRIGSESLAVSMGGGPRGGVPKGRISLEARVDEAKNWIVAWLFFLLSLILFLSLLVCLLGVWACLLGAEV